jgi:hypothetical protein
MTGLVPAGPAVAVPAGSTSASVTAAGMPVTLAQHVSGSAAFPYVSIDFSNSQLFASDHSLSDLPEPGGEAIWQSTVGGTATPTLSAQTLVSERVGWWLEFFRAPFSFSAARGAVVASGVSPFGEPYQWRLLDRGAVTRTLSVPRPAGFSDKENHPETSGPFTLVRGHVFRADGTLMFEMPNYASSTQNSSDLYGSGLVWSEADSESRRVWYRDVAKPESATNPLLIDSCTCTGVNPSVSIWADTVAWVSADSEQIAVRRLGEAATRMVPVAGAGAGAISLGEGTLAWSVNSVLDLTSARSMPVLVPGMVSRYEPKIDGHLMAGIADGAVRVARLPFGRKHRPRLIGVLAPAGFTADGAWSPEFDTTKALRDVRLQITSGAGRTVRNLRGTGSDGSIRDLIWDGRTFGGRALAPGTYHWRLRARAADGEGALIGVDGGPVTGTVELR